MNLRKTLATILFTALFVGLVASSHHATAQTSAQASLQASSDQMQREMKDDETNLDTQLYLLIATNQEIGDTRLQVALERSEEHTSELQSQFHLVCRLLLRTPPTFTLFPYTTLFRSFVGLVASSHHATAQTSAQASLQASSDQMQRETKDDETNLDTQLYLLIATNQDIGDTKLPVALE